LVTIVWADVVGAGVACLFRSLIAGIALVFVIAVTKGAGFRSID
jgi:hypothetical protein